MNRSYNSFVKLSLCNMIHLSYSLINPMDPKHNVRVKSGKFGHQVNSDTHLQTV